MIGRRRALYGYWSSCRTVKPGNVGPDDARGPLYVPALCPGPGRVSVLGGHSIIGSQHHVHGGRRVPALVNTQFTLWSDQAINRQEFDDLSPFHAASTIVEDSTKKVVQSQFLPQPTA